VIEHRTFRLRDGVDVAAFLAADARFTEDVAYQQPGIARRTLARAEDGEWLVETLWWTMAHAISAVHADASLDAFIDAATVQVRRYDDDTYFL
jgi:hypothetical protein